MMDVRLAELPAPPKLSEEDLERLDVEAITWREAVEAGTRSMEWLTDKDFKICVRSVEEDPK